MKEVSECSDWCFRDGLEEERDQFRGITNMDKRTNTKKRIFVIALVILICAIVTIVIYFLLKKRSVYFDYEKAVANYPGNRMLEFDETYYFNGSDKVEEDIITGTNWRVDYNGHVEAFKFRSGSDYFDYVEFDLSQDETKKLWEYADSLEGNYVPSGYEGYAYSSVLYKWNNNGEKILRKFSGLPDDYPLAKEIFSILFDAYELALED